VADKNYVPNLNELSSDSDDDQPKNTLICPRNSAINAYTEAENSANTTFTESPNSDIIIPTKLLNSETIAPTQSQNSATITLTEPISSDTIILTEPISTDTIIPTEPQNRATVARIEPQSSVLITPTKKGKKKRKCPQMWKRNITKRLRNEGKEYVTRGKNKKIREARKVKQPCGEKYRLKCSANISEEQRQEMRSSLGRFKSLYN
jgi:hypothetical protein